MTSSLYLLLTEPTRGAFDAIKLAATYKCLMRNSPKGEGVIITVPGFTGNDASMYFMRSFLTSIGYECHGWGQGLNTSITPESIEKFAKYVQKLSDDIGQPIQLIGHSLGGVYSREVAKLVPDSVAGVITLGSPFNNPIESVNKHIIRLYRKFNKTDSHDDEILAELRNPPQCDVHCLYSKYDGVTHWSACVQDGDYDNCNNHSVDVSHIGMVHSPAVLKLISNILHNR